VNRIACIIVALVAGCATEGQGIDVSFDSSSKGSEAPLRGSAGYDAGIATPEVGRGIDSSQIVDTSATPDARTTLDGLPCMQQVVANGYASDKASCATWKGMNVAPGWTLPAACVHLIDCYAANPTLCKKWSGTSEETCAFCMADGVFRGGDWQPLIDIISPFCPMFF
jgi:hypothetical protein